MNSMPLDFNKWVSTFPDESDLARAVLKHYRPSVPWHGPNSETKFNDDIPPTYGDLWTECFNGAKKGFCERVAQFINYTLMVCIDDTPPRAFNVADTILTGAGLIQQKAPVANWVEKKFYGVAGPRLPWPPLATVLETYWK